MSNPIHIVPTPTGAWWEVDLGSSYFLSEVKVKARRGCCGESLSDSDIFLFDGTNKKVASYHIAQAVTGQDFNILASSFD